jgi:hypothetical protein
MRCGAGWVLGIFLKPNPQTAPHSLLKFGLRTASKTQISSFSGAGRVSSFGSMRFVRALHTPSDAGGSESDDVELSDCTLMALDYLEREDQRKIGKKS